MYTSCLRSFYQAIFVTEVIAHLAFISVIVQEKKSAYKASKARSDLHYFSKSAMIAK